MTVDYDRSVPAAWIDKCVIATHADADLLLDSDLINQRGRIVRAEETHAFGHTFQTPVIRLDDGREWRGYECWWTEDWDGAAETRAGAEPNHGR
jgi:hypothetical protein